MHYPTIGTGHHQTAFGVNACGGPIPHAWRIVTRRFTSRAPIAPIAPGMRAARVSRTRAKRG